MQTIYRHAGLEVRQSGDRRLLITDDGLIQSEIYMSRPDSLPNPVSRAMLAHLLFCPPPRRVLLAGCGGGGIARWLRARSPDTEGVAVELFAEVAQLARSHFDFPASQGPWCLQVQDVREYLQGPVQGMFDFVLVDIAEAGCTPAWLGQRHFITQCSQCLTDAGVLTLNLIPRDAAELVRLLWNLRQVFDRRVLCLALPDRANVIALAFRQTPDTRDLGGAVDRAEARWSLEFGQFLQHMRAQNPPGSGKF